MRDITGTLEEPGSADNPVIIAWADEIAKKFPEMRLYCAQYTHDSIPWCGLTVGYVMAHNGIRPVFGLNDTDKFLWARAWAQFGTKVDTPQLGDVLVFPGHVTLYDGQDGEYYLCRGGNQSDSVKVSYMPKDSVIAIRRPPGALLPTIPSKPIPTAPPSKTRYTSIIATVFGGVEDPNESAYDGHQINDEELGVALPYHFPGIRPKVRVFSGDKFIDCDIVDVGPWNTNDKYWESNGRPQAESGVDNTGRPTNKAGIDLTPAAALALQINGKGTVDWMFIPATVKSTNREEQVVRDNSTKMQLFAKVRIFVQALVATVSGWFTADNFGLLNSWLGIGEGKIPYSTLFTLALGGLAVWLLINVLDKMNMDDFKAGRWMPSGLANESSANTITSNKAPTPNMTTSEGATPSVPVTEPESPNAKIS
jgi:uncharacterized protein (TIGR02594 family)